MGGIGSKLEEERLMKLVNETHFTKKEIKEWYRGYLSDCPDDRLTKPQFIKIYHQFFPHGDPSKFAEYVFETMNTRTEEDGGDEIIEFDEFLKSLSITARGTLDEKLSWAFKLYDVDRSGTISREEMENVVVAIFEMVGNHTKSISYLNPRKLLDGTEESYQKTPTARVDRIFQLFDTSKDGEITCEEFIRGAQADKSIVQALSLYDGLV